jgi:hypothetical protein
MAQGLYLGKEFDPNGAATGARLELDPADLLTHGLIVGMTGSGKTGLAVALIEELLRQGTPVLAIDPKGDLANLLLLFDDLAPASFLPWIDPDAARREGLTREAAAQQAAASWRQGLADWGLSASDIAGLRAAREALIYTPGSSAGLALDVLQSLAAPSVPFESAAEDLRDEIASIATGLLGLLGIEADPLQSREVILLANLIEAAWRKGQGLTLETLLAGVAEPPFEKLGALPLEAVYPRKERQALMMQLNNLLAAPSFEAWRVGQPLDIARLLRAPDGRPRLAIVSTAHLAEAERLFVTALVLDKVKTWMRRQSGTSELRAVVYMDEIFGYFPPHPANPPTKKPLLTLLKQARAQGVGVVLATQNPVDLDYKGLANIGTWLVGKLQTEQDRARLRDGLVGSGLDRADIERLLDATRKRVFLLHDVHRSRPTLMHSRWALSYLRGPLTREEIATLMQPHKGAAPNPAGTPAQPSASTASAPLLPEPFRAFYLKHYGGQIADAHLLVKYAVRYKGLGELGGLRLWPLQGQAVTELLEGEPLEAQEEDLAESAPADLRYSDPPAWLAAAGGRGVERALKERLADKLTTVVLTDPVTKTSAAPGESRTDFARRLASAGDGAVVDKLADKLAKKRADLAVREQELSGRKQEKWLAVGGAILSNLGIFGGRKKTITGAGAVVSKNRMENTAEARVEALQAEVAALEAEMEELRNIDPARFEETPLVPAKSAVKVLRFEVVWVY